jgi:hypothetical protein
MSQNVNAVAGLKNAENAVIAALNAVANAASQVGQGIPVAQERAESELAGATARIRAGVASLASLASATVGECQDILAGLDGLLAGILADATPAVPALPDATVATPDVIPLPPPADKPAESVSKAANGPVEGSKPVKADRVKLNWVRLSEGILDALDGTYRVERTGDGWTAYYGGTVLGTFPHHNTAKKAAADHYNGE